MEHTNIINKRPSIEGKPLESGAIGAIARPLNVLERLWNMEWLRKVAILVFIVASWEMYARHINNPLMFPTFIDMSKAFWTSMTKGHLLAMSFNSFSTLTKSFFLAVVLALPITILATLTRFGHDLLELKSSILSVTPAIALLPISLLWFGISEAAVIFVVTNAVLWPFAQNMLQGFKSTPAAIRMVGANYGLSGLRYAFLVLIPASMGFIISGLRTGFTLSWRTLVAVEIVLGAVQNVEGLGAFLNNSKNNLDIPEVFAGIVVISIIGLLVENLVFRPLEKCTIKKWGMSN